MTHKSFNQRKSFNPLQLGDQHVQLLSILRKADEKQGLINLKFKARARLFNSHEGNIVSSDFTRIIY